MKKVIVFTSILPLIVVLTSCTKESTKLDSVSSDKMEMSDVFIALEDELAIIMEMSDEDLNEQKEQLEGKLKSNGLTLYNVYPRKGSYSHSCRPFRFKVRHSNSPSPDIQVEVVVPDGNVHYVDLVRSQDNQWQYIYVYLNVFGKIDWRYVWKSNKVPITYVHSFTSYETELTTTGVSKLGWPFGRDGSSWAHHPKWKMEPLGGGTHTGNEAQAQDWNFFESGSFSGDNQDDDLGKVIDAPLCGTVVMSGYLDNCNGYWVEIDHITNSGKTFTYRILHMDYIYPEIVRNYKVNLGTRIGKLGGTGSPCIRHNGTFNWDSHFHGALLELGSNGLHTDAALPFQFSK